MIRGNVGTALLAGCVALLAPGDALALLQSCTVAATGVNFSTYNPLSASPNDATSTVTVDCQNLIVGLFVNYTVSLSSGSSGNYTQRHMQSGSSTLNYNLFLTASHTTVWGDGSGGTGTNGLAAILIVGDTQTPYTAYGRIFAGQDRAAGNYSDTIIVTLTY
jgi:spore coat protein U-like protein